jgi:hypothetical protein
MASSTPKVKNDDNWLGEDENKLPSTLNVLTILTIIASSLGFITSFWAFFHAQASYDAVVLVQSSPNSPDWAKKFTGPHPVETARAMLDNRLPVLVISLLSVTLCFIGALQMRKLKKVGFSIYVLGDLVYYTLGIFIGFEIFTSFAYVFGICVSLLFIILYAAQLKHLK